MKADNLDQMRKLKTELLLRSAHNQFQINSVQATIKSFLRQNYAEDFDGLIEVIPKLYGFLVHCQQSPEVRVNSTCPSDILDKDIFKEVRQHTYGNVLVPTIRLMTMEENYMYRDLVGDNGEPSDCNIPIDPKTSNQDEKEKYVYHDSNINNSK